MDLFKFFRKRPKPTLKLICFDLDNTLYDYGSAEAESEAHVAQEIIKDIKAIDRHVKLMPMDILRVFNYVKHDHMHKDTEPEKFSRRLWFTESLDKLNLNLDSKTREKLASKYEKHYWSYLVPRIKMFRNTIKTLDMLKLEGFQLACLTDSDGARDIKLKRIQFLGLDKYFDFIVTTDDTHRNKPDKANFKYILKLSGLSGEECVMVGDHPEVDLINAKKIGFGTIWSKEHIHTGTHYPYVDHEITDISQVVEILGHKHKEQKHRHRVETKHK